MSGVRRTVLHFTVCIRGVSKKKKKKEEEEEGRDKEKQQKIPRKFNRIAYLQCRCGNENKDFFFFFFWRRVNKVNVKFLLF